MNSKKNRRQFLFTLPMGLIDSRGSVHRHGVMHLTMDCKKFSTEPQDALESSVDSRLTILSRVITRLGKLSSVTSDHLQRLVLQDEIYLWDAYKRAYQVAQNHFSRTPSNFEARFLKGLLGDSVIL
jgi:hypothetical protein